jgi:ribosomal protein L37AE/L43A
MALVGGRPGPDAGEGNEASEMPTFKAWGFKTLSETANGVLHYPDEPAELYVYDNNVNNSRHVRVGDLAVILDSDYVFGAGWIDSIEVSAQEKIRYRCPSCNKTGFKPRKTKWPVYLCPDCHMEFDAPVEENLDVETYTANYSRTFELAERFFPVSLLEPAFVARSKTNAIRELNVSLLRPLLEENLGVGAPWWDAQEGEDEKIAGGHKLGMRKSRIGQQRFREALLARHGEVCAFTGRQPAAAPEAAHLVPYSKLAEHDVKGGLLLRRDLHVLFDRHLISIDPDTWSILVAPKLMSYPDLAILEGRSVLMRKELRPPRKLIEEHAAAARVSWG